MNEQSCMKLCMADALTENEEKAAMIRKATIDDLDAIERIYNKVHDAEEEGILSTGWRRGVYPTRDTAAAALAKGELYVMDEDGRVTATARLNQSQEEAYYEVDWLYPAEDEEVLVLHTLVVDRDLRSGGRGKAFVEYYEKLARELGCKVTRLDTNARNTAACTLYPSLGYRRAGVVPTVFNGLPDVELVMFEKKLQIKIF